jgi:ATP adenylyltransferase
MPNMAEESFSTERSRNIWAPWRMEYIEALNGVPDGGCFLCRYRDLPAEDASNLVLWRGRNCMALLNRFPYTGGHCMVAPVQHVPDLASLEPPAMLEMMEMLRDLQITLAAAIKCEGFNVGMNIGRCAGAGLPGHLHAHIVPRWSGDTNFMAVLGQVRVIPQSLDAIYKLLTDKGRELGLPKPRP